MKLFCFLFMYLNVGIALAQCPPPMELLEKMQGHWHAEGYRLSHVSQKKSKIQSETYSIIKNDHIVISQETKEWEQPEKNPRIHRSQYWIRAKKTENCNSENSQRIYELGTGETELSNPAKYLGYYSKNIFLTQQNITANYIYKSKTQFNDDHTVTNNSTFSIIETLDSNSSERILSTIVLNYTISP